MIATPITMLVVSFFCAPYLKKWRDFSGFFRWTTASQAVAALNWQMDQLVSRLELGRFSMAANLSALPTQIFVGLHEPSCGSFLFGQRRYHY
jgi:PST family polysaccharide transporter